MHIAVQSSRRQTIQLLFVPLLFKKPTRFISCLVVQRYFISRQNHIFLRINYITCFDLEVLFVFTEFNNREALQQQLYETKLPLGRSFQLINTPIHVLCSHFCPDLWYMLFIYNNTNKTDINCSPHPILTTTTVNICNIYYSYFKNMSIVLSRTLFHDTGSNLLKSCTDTDKLTE